MVLGPDGKRVPAPPPPKSHTPLPAASDSQPATGLLASVDLLQVSHGGSVTHGAQGVLRATLRREGWASARSPASDAVGAAAFQSVPLAVPSAASACGAPGAQLWLLLNVRTAAAGRVAVTLLASDARTPLPGFDSPSPFTGNAIRVPAGWTQGGAGNISSDISALAGSSVVVRVELVHAELFAWEVQCVV
jgi:hypothetical protein